MSRIDDLIEELCPNGVESKTLGEIGELVRGNGLPKADLTETLGSALSIMARSTRHYGTWATDTISFVAPELAAKLAKVAQATSSSQTPART